MLPVPAGIFALSHKWCGHDPIANKHSAGFNYAIPSDAETRLTLLNKGLMYSTPFNAFSRHNNIVKNIRDASMTIPVSGIDTDTEAEYSARTHKNTETSIFTYMTILFMFVLL